MRHTLFGTMASNLTLVFIVLAVVVTSDAYNPGYEAKQRWDNRYQFLPSRNLGTFF